MDPHQRLAQPESIGTLDVHRVVQLPEASAVAVDKSPGFYRVSEAGRRLLLVRGKLSSSTC